MFTFIIIVAIIAIAAYVAPGHTTLVGKTIAPHVVPTVKLGLDTAATLGYLAVEAKYTIKATDNEVMAKAKAMDTKAQVRDIERISQEIFGMSDTRKSAKAAANTAKARYEASLAEA